MSNLDLAQFGKGDSITGTDPAANTEATITLPTGPSQKWVLLSASINLVQGATQTPLPSLVVKNAAGTIIAQFPGASAATSASTTSQFNWYPGAALTAGAGATVNTAPLPSGLVLAAGWTLTTSTSGIGANSNYGSLAIWVIAL